MNINNYTLEEYKDYFFTSKYFTSLGRLQKIFYYIGVIQFRFFHINGRYPEWKNERRYNPWHPLTYVAMIIVILTIILYSLWEGVKVGLEEWRYNKLLKWRDC